MKEPRETCQWLDSAIEEIEYARENAIQLRAWGNYWKEEYEKQEEFYLEIIKHKDEEIKDLQYQIKDAIASATGKGEL